MEVKFFARGINGALTPTLSRGCAGEGIQRFAVGVTECFSGLAATMRRSPPSPRPSTALMRERGIQAPGSAARIAMKRSNSRRIVSIGWMPISGKSPSKNVG